MFDFLKKQMPSRPGIHGREDYFNSAVLVPLLVLSGVPHLLFEKRSAGLRQEHEICFPGGKVDSRDASSEAAALRETGEELGIGLDKIRVLGQLDSVVAPMGAVVDCFVGTLEIGSLVELNPNPSEVSRVLAIPVAHFMLNPAREYSVRLEVQPEYLDENGERVVLLPVAELGLPQRYSQPWGRRRHRVFVYPYESEMIWGMTAEITRMVTGLFPADFIPFLTQKLPGDTSL